MKSIDHKAPVDPTPSIEFKFEALGFKQIRFWFIQTAKDSISTLVHFHLMLKEACIWDLTRNGCLMCPRGNVERPGVQLKISVWAARFGAPDDSIFMLHRPASSASIRICYPPNKEFSAWLPLVLLHGRVYTVQKPSNLFEMLNFREGLADSDRPS